jgi:hypothetical protein
VTKTPKRVTLRLPEQLLQRFRTYAEERNQPMSSLMARAIEQLMEHDEEYEKAKRRAIRRMHNAPDLGTNGKITWTRDELYER